MTFLTPMTALIAAAIAVPLLLVLYFLKLHRRSVDVSSSLLWKQTLASMEANTPFQRLRRQLLLLLQLLILAAILLAMARPVWRGDADAIGEQLVLLIDQSASMNARDTPEGSRLDAAKAQAKRRVDAADGGVMVISFARSARVVLATTTDKAAARQAIDAIEPTDEAGGLAAALALVDAMARSDAAEQPQPRVVVLSDGRVSDGTDLSVARGKVEYQRIGPASLDDVDNVAITAMSAARSPGDATAAELFVQVTNFSPRAVSTTLTLMRGDRVAAVRPVELPARGDATVTPPSVGMSFQTSTAQPVLLTARLDQADALAADNEASLWLMPARGRRVLLVTGRNAFLERALAAMPGQTVAAVRVMKPLDYERLPAPPQPRVGVDDEQGVDLVVFDGHTPAALPGVSSLSFGATVPVDGLRIEPIGEARTTRVLHWARDHRLMQHVTMEGVVVRPMGRLLLPDDGEALAMTAGGTVLGLVQEGSAMHIAAAFRTLDSDWLVQVSFVVFLSNVLEQVAGSAAPDVVAFEPGEAITLPMLTASSPLVYDGPMPLAATRRDDGSWSLPTPRRAGLYRAAGSVPSPWDVVPVNLVDAGESDLLPARALAIRSAGQVTDVAAQPERRELWRWLLAAGAVVLMIEWFVYVRKHDMRR